MIKIEIKSICGSVLFSYEKKDNTLKETIEKAIKSGANLSGRTYPGRTYPGRTFLSIVNGV